MPSRRSMAPWKKKETMSPAEVEDSGDGEASRNPRDQSHGLIDEGLGHPDHMQFNSFFPDVSTKEPGTTQARTSERESSKSNPKKIRRLSERSVTSVSNQPTSHSSSHGAAPEKRWVRCAYYTQVRTVKGVAMAWHTKTSFAPVGKMPQVFEAELWEESTIGSAPSLVNTESLVSALEPWQEGPEANPLQPSVQDEEHRELPRAATPEWLVTCERGFRCVACCRVFDSRAALMAHAEHGVREGFSCRVFYEELLKRRLPPSAPCRPRRCHQMEGCRSMAAKEKEVREKRKVCRRLEQQLQKEREELKGLKHQLEELQRPEARLQRLRARGQSGKRLKTL